MGERLTPLPEAKIELLEEAVTGYEMERDFNDTFSAYAESRGLEDETVDRFRLGLVGDAAPPTHQKYRGMLAIPYLGLDGRPRNIRFRCMQEHDCKEYNHPKYNQPKGQPIQSYNGSRVWSAGSQMHITEGEFDAMILEQAGIPAVGFPGAQAWKRHHRNLFLGFDKVWVWGDPDEAGADFIEQVTGALWMSRGVTLKVGDVTDTYMHGGEAALHELIGA